MALLDMIKQSITDKATDDALEMYQRDSHMADMAAMESMGGFDLPPLREEILPDEWHSMSAMEALMAMESHYQLKGEQMPLPKDTATLIHESLECDLPEGAPPYDPSAELEDLAQTLAGLDADDNVDPDQPSPEDDLENSTAINDLGTEPNDTEDPDEAGTISVEAFMDKVRGFKNRKNQVDYPDDFPTFTSVKDMIEKTREQQGDADICGKVSNVPLMLDMSLVKALRDGHAMALKDVNTYISMTPKVTKDAVDALTKDGERGNCYKIDRSKGLGLGYLRVVFYDKYGHAFPEWGFTAPGTWGVFTFGNYVDPRTGKPTADEGDRLAYSFDD
jgi:hypothetical protein